jgi:hypothetical protein
VARQRVALVTIQPNRTGIAAAALGQSAPGPVSSHPPAACEEIGVGRCNTLPQRDLGAPAELRQL